MRRWSRDQLEGFGAARDLAALRARRDNSRVRKTLDAVCAETTPDERFGVYRETTHL
ncbi:MAG: hypothetical protein ABSH44_20275 [Bryobacteraceae bacterium]